MRLGVRGWNRLPVVGGVVVGGVVVGGVVVGGVVVGVVTGPPAKICTPM
jgi:hypothetical protein